MLRPASRPQTKEAAPVLTRQSRRQTRKKPNPLLVNSVIKRPLVGLVIETKVINRQAHKQPQQFRVKHPKLIRLAQLRRKTPRLKFYNHKKTQAKTRRRSLQKVWLLEQFPLSFHWRWRLLSGLEGWSMTSARRLLTRLNLNQFSEVVFRWWTLPCSG